jgi:hypothetical protein
VEIRAIHIPATARRRFAAKPYIMSDLNFNLEPPIYGFAAQTMKFWI